MSLGGCNRVKLLRSIEWFQGVVFLTPNRPQNFDEAFRSRIHMSICHPPLNGATRACIWHNLLKGGPTPSDWEMSVFRRLNDRYELDGREKKKNLVLFL
jgi:hypothetical protein